MGTMNMTEDRKNRLADSLTKMVGKNLHKEAVEAQDVEDALEFAIASLDTGLIVDQDLIEQLPLLKEFVRRVGSKRATRARDKQELLEKEKTKKND